MTTINNEPLKTDLATEEYQIQLLQEKLKIERSKRKVGEVVIRKEVETHIIEIPVRQEKLIVEQIGDETIRLAEIDLSRETITGVDGAYKLRPSGAPLAPLGETPSPQWSYRATAETAPHLFETNLTNAPVTVEGKFSSLEQAVEILAMIARQPPHGCTQVQVKLLLEDPKFQQTYQIMFQQYAEKPVEQV